MFHRGWARGGAAPVSCACDAMKRLSFGSRNSSRDSSGDGGSSSADAVGSPSPRSSFSTGLTRSLTMMKRPSSSRGMNVAAMSDEQLRAKIIELFSNMEHLRATLRDLKVQRERMSNPAFFETDIHEMFLNGSGFQEVLQTLQTCQEQQKAYLADKARVESLCPKEYPELLKLSVDVMTSFSRLAAAPGSTVAPEEISSAADSDRQKSLTAVI